MDALQNPQHTEANFEYQEQKPFNWVPIKEEVAFTPKKLRIIGVGSGFAGLTLAYKIKHGLKLDGVVDFVLYEKNADVGGVWFENRYPGGACDVPAHAYSFLFEPNPDWSHFYAGGCEIREYIKKTTRKWGLDEHIQFNSRILEAMWDEAAGKWKVKIGQHGTIIEDEAEIFISATGVLNNWKWPDIQGLEDFKGKLVHTANWDDSFDWLKKRVAVLGNGSSGIQCSTAMHKKVSKMVNYVCSPTWISPNVCADLTKDGTNFAFSEEERKTFRDDPDAFFEMRKTLENSVNGFYYAMLRDHLFQQMCGSFASQKMQQALQNCRDPAIAAWMKPDFRPGCRRLTPGDGYLESFSEPNTRMCFEPIDRITETGITTKDGHHDEFDMIVCASGFNTSYIPSWKVEGRRNVTLSHKWRENPEAFFSVHVDDMPNYFMIAGPNFPTANHAALDFTSDYRPPRLDSRDSCSSR